jgi:uncharacterized membrane protein
VAAVAGFPACALHFATVDYFPLLPWFGVVDFNFPPFL